MKIQSLLRAGFLCTLFLGVSCSHIEMDRSPSSLKSSVGQCQIVADKNGREWQVMVGDKPYPNADKLAHHEAYLLMNRYSQTGTCDL